MTRGRHRKMPRRLRAVRIVGVVASIATFTVAQSGLVLSASADSYVPISGAGSTWSQNALDQWRRNVAQYGMTVNYQGTGSSDGRSQFGNGTVDFAVSEIPYGLKDNGVVDTPPSRKFAYMPIVAGGTSFMYNLQIAGQRVTNLRLSGSTLAKIFTGVITRWDDPQIKQDNPQLALPGRPIVPVVRSDGSGTTAQFTLWMSKTQPDLWNAYCAKAGLATPCGLTSTYPVIPGSGFTAQSGSLGVSGYVAQSQSVGAITYVESSYALNTGFPVAKVLNAAGYYTQPTAQNVAVALLKARINDDASSPSYLTQILDDVYSDPDPRTYPLSSYSYMIIPTALQSPLTTAKGRTLGDFAYYFLCEGQQQAPVLGYSPLPINLVQAGLDQVRKIPGVDVQKIDISKCNNPTFSSDGTNTLAATAPQPPDCDKQGATQCSTGTGGAAQTPTAPSAGTPGAAAGASPTDTTSPGGTSSATAGGGGVRGSPSGAGSTKPGSTVVAGSAAGVPLAGAAAAAVPHIDPDTGQLIGGSTGAAAARGSGTDATGASPTSAGTSFGGVVGGGAAAVPVSLAATIGSTTQRSLVLFSLLLLVVSCFGPPLYARKLLRETPA